MACELLHPSAACTLNGASNLPEVAKSGNVPEAENLMEQMRPWRATGASAVTMTQVATNPESPSFDEGHDSRHALALQSNN